MQIDWLVVATIAGPLLGALIGAPLVRMLERRPNVITWLGSGMPEILVSDEMHARLAEFKHVVETVIQEQMGVQEYVESVLDQGINHMLALLTSGGRIRKPWSARYNSSAHGPRDLCMGTSWKCSRQVPPFANRKNCAGRSVSTRGGLNECFE